MVVKAGRTIASTDHTVIREILLKVADAAVDNSEMILEANRLDLDLMDRSDPKYDRLLLSAERIRNIASDMRNVANLPDPLGRVLSEVVRPNGLVIRRVSVPFGVI
jgi:glutamate-5-semialdehyde dehydrogenase